MALILFCMVISLNPGSILVMGWDGGLQGKKDKAGV